jgi:hypothetical protein
VTQAERVLRAARSFRGTCQADWLADETPDGSPRITRVAARIQDLEAEGCVFEIIGVRSKTRVYRLVEQQPSEMVASINRAATSVALARDTDKLFEVGESQSSNYDIEAA